MTKDKLGFAVIGLGRMGKRRVETIIQNPNAELVCVVDVNEKITEDIANKNNCIWFNEFEKAILQDDVDCVVVAAPNKFHAPISIAALESGKHVFCEKPLARNPDEALTMLEAALHNNVFLKTGSNLRYFPSVSRAKELLDSKAIGELMFIRGWIGNDGRQLKDSWFSNFEMAGGGTFLDNGCHLLDLVRWFLGEIEECKGYITTAYWPVNPLEDNGFGIFKTTEGKLAFVQSSWVEWAEYMYLEIYGKEGFIYVENRNRICKTTLGKKNGARYVFDYSLQPVVSYQLEMQDFIEAIFEKRQPLPSGYDGLRAVQMAYGVYESSKSGHAVNIYGETEKRLSELVNEPLKSSMAIKLKMART